MRGVCHHTGLFFFTLTRLLESQAVLLLGRAVAGHDYVYLYGLLSNPPQPQRVLAVSPNSTRLAPSKRASPGKRRMSEDCQSPGRTDTRRPPRPHSLSLLASASCSWAVLVEPSHSTPERYKAAQGPGPRQVGFAGDRHGVGRTSPHPKWWAHREERANRVGDLAPHLCHGCSVLPVGLDGAGGISAGECPPG